MTDAHVRALPERPSLEYLKKLAKQRLAELRRQDPASRLAAAQLAVAREHGFASWRALKAEVDRRERAARPPDARTEAIQAAQSGRVQRLRALLDADPALLQSVGASTDVTDKPLLHHAAAGGHVHTVALLLERGAEVDRRCAGDRATALHFAAENGHLEIVQRLVAAGADVGAAGADHASTPLGWATSMGRVHEDVAAYLLERGAVPELFPCVALGRVREVRAALAADPRALESAQGPLEHRRRPLHLAALASQPAMVDLLLAAGADPEAPDAEGETPLMYATRDGVDRAIAERLIAVGARVDMLSALGLGRTALAERLLQEDPRRLQPGGCDERALLLACAQRALDVVRWLLAHGAPPDAKHEYWSIRQAPLHHAAGMGYADVVRVLLEGGASRDVRDDSFGSDPAGWARHFGKPEIAELIAGWK